MLASNTQASHPNAYLAFKIEYASLEIYIYESKTVLESAKQNSTFVFILRTARLFAPKRKTSKNPTAVPQVAAPAEEQVSVHIALAGQRD